MKNEEPITEKFYMFRAGTQMFDQRIRFTAIINIYRNKTSKLCHPALSLHMFKFVRATSIYIIACNVSILKK